MRRGCAETDVRDEHRELLQAVDEVLDGRPVGRSAPRPMAADTSAWQHRFVLRSSCSGSLVASEGGALCVECGWRSTDKNNARAEVILATWLRKGS